MIFDLFKVQAISGELSKSSPSYLKSVFSGGEDTLVAKTDSGLDHEDSKDKEIEMHRVDWIINEMTQALNNATEGSFKYESHWLHVHDRNMSTNTHSHLPSKWSSACYLQVPEGSGKLCFISEQLEQMVTIAPEVGKYLIFPSLAKHYVTAHESDTPRVCLSVNWA